MSPNPSTIILALWRDTTAAATEELKISYATKFPRAKIFLLREGGGGEEEGNKQQQQLLLADDNHNNHNQNNDDDDDHLLLSPTKKSILIHISDHHAATQICQFLREHLSRTGNVLDVGTVIFDYKNKPSQLSTSLRRWWILPSFLLWCWWSSNFISFLAIWISRRMVGGGGDESLYCRWTWIRHDFVDGGILPGDVRLEFLGRKSMMEKKEKKGEERNGDDDGCEEELLIGGGVWFSDWRG